MLHVHKFTVIYLSYFREFMATHTLRFLGAALTPYCDYEMFADEKKTEIIVSLRRGNIS